MPKAATFCNDILALILNTTAIANIAQNNTTSPDTNFYFSLHTADPGTSIRRPPARSRTPATHAWRCREPPRASVSRPAACPRWRATRTSR